MVGCNLSTSSEIIDTTHNITHAITCFKIASDKTSPAIRSIPESMAASVAGVGQFFSRKNVTSSESLLRCFGARKSSSFAMVRNYSRDQLSICLSSPQINRRCRRISAAVAEDEAAASSVEESPVKEEIEDEVMKSPVNTKLYFGNLPYNCDSSQLAGVIQEYASPEMIEVSTYLS